MRSGAPIDLLHPERRRAQSPAQRRPGPAPLHHHQWSWRCATSGAHVGSVQLRIVRGRALSGATRPRSGVHPRPVALRPVRPSNVAPATTNGPGWPTGHRPRI